MDLRKVIHIRGTHYISIPLEIVKSLEIKPGEKLKVAYVPGSGIFITQLKAADKAPLEVKSIEVLKKAADSVYSQLEKRLKELETKSIENYFTLMIQQLSRLGIFELEKRVSRMEKRSVEMEKVKGELVLIRQHKKKLG
jgi:hypothetical protein